MSTTNRTMICPKCGVENNSWRSRCQKCGALLHNDEDIKINPPLGGLWLTAFIIGLVYAGLLISFMLAFGEWLAWELQLPELLPVLVAALIFGSVALAWKWELISGVVLIVEGLFLVIWFTLFTEEPPMFFLPLLASGILFILIWRKGRRASASSASPEGNSRQD